MNKIVAFCERYSIALIPLCLVLLGCGIWPEMEILVPSLPDMKKVFGIEDSHIQNLLTVNFIGFLIGVLFAGPLCDSIGRKKVLLFGSIAYLLSSLLCALGTSFPLLILGRFLQGLTMTGPMIAGCVLIMECTQGTKQYFWMTLSNSLATLCIAVAPIVGSWINIQFGFQGNLWAIFILGSFAIFPSLFFVPETLESKNRKSLDLDKVFEGYIDLLKDRRFMCQALPICAVAAAYWIYVGVSALYMVDYLGISEASFGHYQGPIAGCFSIVSLSSSRLMTRFGLLKCVNVGFAFMFLGVTLLLLMTLSGGENPELTTIFMMLFVGGMAPVCGLLWPHVLSHLPPNLQGNAQSLLQALRLLIASCGTFTLGFVYEGPLFPVVLMFSGILIFSSTLLWFGREFISEENTGNSDLLAAGH